MKSSSVEFAPPTAISERHAQNLVRGLDFGGRPVKMLPYKRRDAVLSGGGSSGQLLEWVLSISQAGAWDWMAAFLGGYAGKEFLKGFAGEAGKDFWKAVKCLASRISGDNQLQPKAKHQ